MIPIRIVISADVYTILAIVLIILRRTDRIDWPWVWVTAPLWVPLVVAAVAGLWVAVPALWEAYGRP